MAQGFPEVRIFFKYWRNSRYVWSGVYLPYTMYVTCSFKSILAALYRCPRTKMFHFSTSQDISSSYFMAHFYNTVKLVTLFQEILNLEVQLSGLRWRTGASSTFELFHLQFTFLNYWIGHKPSPFPQYKSL